MSQQNYSDGEEEIIDFQFEEEIIDFQFIDEDDYQNGRQAFNVTPVPINPTILELLQRHERELTLAERARTPAQRAEIDAEIAADNQRRIDMEARGRNDRIAAIAAAREARAAHPLRPGVVARRLFQDEEAEEADVENHEVNSMMR